MARARVSGLSIRPFTDDLAPAFHDINVQWITAMFALEPTDRDVPENPRARIVAPGGDIGFVHDAEIMREFGVRCRRCDVAMRYAGSQ